MKIVDYTLRTQSKNLPLQQVWIDFSEKLKELNKRYIRADKQFVEGLNGFCNSIKRGHGISRTSKSGYHYSKKWVLNSFIKIFDPLLAIEKDSLIKVDLINQLAFDNKLCDQERILTKHLTIENIDYFAELFWTAHLRVSDRMQQSQNIVASNEYLRCGETLAMLASILYCLHSNLTHEKIDWCISCFRRAITNSKYCPVHSPRTKSNTNYKKYRKLRKKFRKFLKKEKKPISKFYQSLRLLFDSNVGNYSIRACSDEDFLKTNLIHVNNEILSIADSTSNESWDKAATAWDKLIRNKFPHINNLLEIKATSSSSWEEFISLVREELNETIENETNPLWFYFELCKAEDWLIAENVLNPKMTKIEFVADLQTQGKSFLEIKKETKLGSSRLYQILSILRHKTNSITS